MQNDNSDCPRRPHHGHGPSRRGFEADFAAGLARDVSRGDIGFVRAMGGPRFVGAGPFGADPGRMRGRRARRGLVRDSVLVLLAEQPRNGYQLMTELAERTMGGWQPSPGAVYPCLAQLADEGLIEQVEVEGQRVYQVTSAGSTLAATLNTAPWADTDAPLSERDGQAAHALWGEFRHLAKSLHLASEQATPAQLAALTVQVQTWRHSVFALLATGDAAE